MNILILFKFIDGPWGGGNQFLKNLKRNLIKKKKYSHNIFSANAILINSHHLKYQLLLFKLLFKKKIFVHRIDGPLNYRSKKKVYENENIKIINNYIADATIYQSKWSKKENDIKFTKISDVIWNAPDPEIFSASLKKKESKKINLISTCWSKNLNKGHDIYRFLDRNLNFNKYDLTLIGRSPYSFKNIKLISPLKSYDLSNYLKKSDIFIFCSKREACSNSLLEALHSQLPVVYASGSSNNEIVDSNGVSFNNYDILEKIDYVSQNLKYFNTNFKNIYPNIDGVTDQYLSTFKKIKSLISNKMYNPKKINLLFFFIILFKFFVNDIKDKLK